LVRGEDNVEKEQKISKKKVVLGCLRGGGRLRRPATALEGLSPAGEEAK